MSNFPARSARPSESGDAQFVDPKTMKRPQCRVCEAPIDAASGRFDRKAVVQLSEAVVKALPVECPRCSAPLTHEGAVFDSRLIEMGDLSINGDTRYSHKFEPADRGMPFHEVAARAESTADRMSLLARALMDRCPGLDFGQAVRRVMTEHAEGKRLAESYRDLI